MIKLKLLNFEIVGVLFSGGTLNWYRFRFQDLSVLFFMLKLFLLHDHK